MQLDIDEIVVRRRVRKNLGDLSSLMESMKKYGLLNPIVVNSQNELIAGHRRLESARRLGWRVVSARVVDDSDVAQQLEMEMDENTQRKNLSTEELADGYIRLDRLRNPGIFRRIWNAIRSFFRRIFIRRAAGRSRSPSSRRR